MKASRGIIWLISRCRPRPAGPHINSPLIFDWRKVGRIRAINRDRALDRAEEITGAARDNLIVVGVQADNGHQQDTAPSV